VAVAAAQVSVGTSATSVLQAGDAGVEAVVRNAGAASVFLGGSGVATTDGYELEVGSTVRLLLTAGDQLFGVVATGTEEIHVISA